MVQLRSVQGVECAGCWLNLNQHPAFKDSITFNYVQQALTLIRQPCDPIKRTYEAEETRARTVEEGGVKREEAKGISRQLTN